MKLQILSGLNIDCDEFQPAASDSDVVVLAGDIAHGVQGMRWARRTFDKPIIYVLGDRELRDFDLGAVDLFKQEAAATGIHLLDREAVEIGGVRFLGCTLWTDFDLFGSTRRSEVMSWAEQWVEAFQFISDMGRPFTPLLARERHLVDRAWLGRRLSESGPSGPTVVVTHHAPHSGHVNSERQRDVACAAFVSSMPAVLASCTLWVHGCAHGSLDYRVERTRVVANIRKSAPESELFVEQAPFAEGLTIDVAEAGCGWNAGTLDRNPEVDESVVSPGLDGLPTGSR